MSDEAWRDFWSGDNESSGAIGGALAVRIDAEWRARLAGCEVPSKAVIVDIASGSGAALSNAVAAISRRSAGTCRFLALDISENALRSALRRVPDAHAAACRGDALPLATDGADIVVSQFGIEYAGVDAFAEAARILAPEGTFCSISHFKGGAIDAECAENSRLLNAVFQTKLFERAEKALAASFNRRARNLSPAVGAIEEKLFAKAMKASANEIAAAPQSAARRSLERFVSDLDRLSVRRLAYRDADALGWISGMKLSLSAYRDRMASMQNAALGDQEIRRVAAIFEGAGNRRFEASPLALVDGAPPAAWIITAK